MTHPRNQDGFALIEVIVSAAVLAIIALAVLAGIDGATASTARERARAVAASLAEQDQERMRGYRFDELANIPQQPDQVIQGVTYKVKSQASWVVDEGSVSANCATSGDKQKEYLRIVTTVSSSLVGARIPDVKVESLVAAPVSGSLVVKVEPADPAKRMAVVAGLSVQVTAKTDGRVSTAQTDAAGCAIFRAIDPGNYTVRLNTPGYVNRQGVQLSESDTTVNAGIVNVLKMTYDRAFRIAITVKTLRPGTTYSTANLVPSKANAVSDISAENNVLRTFTPDPAPSGSFTTDNTLFPFKDTAYSLYVGKCASESPVAVGNTNYFSDANYKAAAVVGDPTGFQPQQATVFTPALNLRITGDYKGDATKVAANMRAYVWIQKVNGAACTSEYQGTALTPVSWPTDTATWGSAPGGQTAGWVSTSATGFDPGLPFGTYKICLYDKGNTRWWSSYTYDNTSPNGKASTVTLPNGGSWSSSGASVNSPPSGCSS